MAVNRYDYHITVLLEDRPYRDIMNGVKLAPQVNPIRIDVRQPAGGWKNVLDQFENDVLPLMVGFPKKHVLLLIDFDNQYDSRKKRFDDIVTQSPIANRAFLLGIDNSESEDLKRHTGHRNYEQIGSLLVRDCPEQTAPDLWQTAHLSCNIPELQRMRVAGVTDWLFS